MRMRLLLIALIFVMMLPVQSVWGQIYMGLFAGGRVPLDSNKIETATGILGATIQVRDIDGLAISLSGGFFGGGAKFPVSYQIPTDNYNYSPLPPYTPERVYETEVSDNNNFSDVFFTLDCEMTLWGTESGGYEVGPLFSIGGTGFTLTPKEELRTKPEHTKKQMVVGLGVRNSFVVSQGRGGSMFQLNVQYWIENHTIKNHTPSLRGNYLAITLAYIGGFF